MSDELRGGFGKGRGEGRPLGGKKTPHRTRRPRTSNWVPEGSLAGFVGCREMAVDLVRGADFSRKLTCGRAPAI